MFKQVNRTLCSALAVVLMLGALTACGNKEDDTLPAAPNLGGLVAGEDANQPTDPNAQAPTPNFGGDGQSNQGGTGDQQLQFDLQSPGENNFDDVPLVRDDSQPTKLYTIDGDYAYELDPNTLTPVGDPLDPVTHQPIAIADQPEPETEEPPAEEGDPEPEPPVVEPDPYLVESNPEPEAEQPVPDIVIDDLPPEIPPEQKLPNTGIFLEDD